MPPIWIELAPDKFELRDCRTGSMIKRAVFYSFVALLVVHAPSWSDAAIGSDGGEAERAPALLLVSIDGFRPDYLQLYEAPTLKRLATEGLHANEGMIPVFPTKTFPCHYSMITGLYAEHHGIVSNTIYDPKTDQWFRVKDSRAQLDSSWWGGEPLWVTAERQGSKAATFFWVGSEALIGGLRPTYWKPYDSSVPGAERVEQVLAWLDLPAPQRPVFLTLYFSEVDSAGHEFGPRSPEVGRAVRRVDGHLARLIAGLERRGLLGQLNLLIVSDHGMTELSTDRIIFLEDYLDLRDVMIVDLSPVLMIRPRPGKQAAVHEALAGAHPRLAIYNKRKLPRRLHFRKHERIPPLIGIADEGWSVVSSRERFDPEQAPRGMHGYDNALQSMRALFVAHGPAFRRGKVAPFESVQLYGLMAAVLGIRPAPNDGDPAIAAGLLAEP